jgi:hypothetical protein
MKFFNHYKEEIESKEVQDFINYICKNYTISKEKIILMLNEERSACSSMEEAIKNVNTRIEFIMI